MEKMIYEKPVLEVEIFQLDAEIAGSCVQGAGHSDVSCVKIDSDSPLFTEGCVADINKGDTCYHLAAGGFFAS